MKKNIITILLIVAILMLTVTTAFAAGGKVQGENGAGSVYRWSQPYQPWPMGIVLYQTSWEGNLILLYSK